eukprot:6302570-Amphidinium_carterae.1
MKAQRNMRDKNDTSCADIYLFTWMLRKLAEKSWRQAKYSRRQRDLLQPYEQTIIYMAGTREPDTAALKTVVVNTDGLSDGLLKDLPYDYEMPQSVSEHRTMQWRS